MTPRSGFWHPHVTLRHNSRLHHIGIGKAHTGTQVLLLVADLHVRVIATATGDLLRALTLDVTRDYQPRGVKPGPQPRKKRKDVAGQHVHHVSRQVSSMSRDITFARWEGFEPPAA